MKKFSEQFNLALGVALVVLIALTVACSSSGECEVKYDKDSGLCVVLLNPPGETGNSKQEGDMKRTTSGSREPGGPLIVKTEYVVNLTRTFEESGNIYTITGHIKAEQKGDAEKVRDYDLTVAGGVYGDSPRHFVKEK